MKNEEELKDPFIKEMLEKLPVELVEKIGKIWMNDLKYRIILEKLWNSNTEKKASKNYKLAFIRELDLEIRSYQSRVIGEWFNKKNQLQMNKKLKKMKKYSSNKKKEVEKKLLKLDNWEEFTDWKEYIEAYGNNK